MGLIMMKSREQIINRDIKLLHRRNSILVKDLKEHFSPSTAEAYDENLNGIVILRSELKGILSERVRIRDEIIRISHLKISKDKKMLLIDKLFDGC